MNISIVLQKQCCDLRMAVPTSQSQWLAAIPIGGTDIGVVFDQEIRDLNTSLLAALVQGSFSFLLMQTIGEQ
jgi:hypothetical protein